MTYDTLTLKFDAHIATITLDRPDKRNAVTAAMIQQVLAALDEIEASSAHIAILTGAGKAVCSGLDLDLLRAISKQSADENLEDSRLIAKLFRRVWSFPKVTIAAVNGPAVGGGFGMATSCDFTLAVPEARFGYPEVRIGFIPALVAVFLKRQVGEKHARDLLLSGRLIDAAQAQRYGLVHEIVPAGQLMSRAAELAASLLENSPASMVRTKRMLCDFAAAEVDRDMELAIAENAKIRSTPEFREGLTSFLEKRPPRWSGR